MNTIIGYKNGQVAGMRMYLNEEQMKRDIKSSEMLKIHFALAFDEVKVCDTTWSYRKGEYPFPMGFSVKSESKPYKEWLKENEAFFLATEEQE